MKIKVIRIDDSPRSWRERHAAKVRNDKRNADKVRDAIADYKAFANDRKAA